MDASRLCTCLASLAVKGERDGNHFGPQNSARAGFPG